MDEWVKVSAPNRSADKKQMLFVAGVGASILLFARAAASSHRMVLGERLPAGLGRIEDCPSKGSMHPGRGLLDIVPCRIIENDRLDPLSFTFISVAFQVRRA